MFGTWPIAKVTFLQTIRQPIFGVMLCVLMAALVLTVPLSMWTMGSNYQETNQRMLAGASLASMLFWSMITGALSASAAISREIEDKTALTVVSKPVARFQFVMGKYLGIAMAISLYYLIGALVFLLTVRHQVISCASGQYDWPVIVLGISALVIAILVAAFGNYMYGWGVISSGVVALAACLILTMVAVTFVGKGWVLIEVSETFGPENIHTQLLLGIVQIFMAVLLLTSVAVMLSTRLRQGATLLATFAVCWLGSQHAWLIARLSDYLAGGDPNAWSVRVLGFLLPNMNVFYPLDRLAKGWELPAGVMGLSAIYFVLFVAAMLLLGTALFQNRDLSASTTSSAMPGPVRAISTLGRLLCVLAWAIAAPLLIQPGLWNLETISILLGVIVAAAVLWGFCIAFGAGKSWTRWVMVTLATLGVAQGIVSLFMPEWLRIWDVREARGLLLVSVAISAGLLVVLFLPKTRHHFQSAA